MKSTPPFTPHPKLESQRIVLRAIIESDYQQLIEISFYDGIPAKDASDAKIMNERIMKDYENGNTVHWIITSKSSGEVLGTAGFYRGFDADAGEIGYVLKEKHRGQGHMLEAVRLLLAFGWEQLGLNAIVAMTDPNNQASINVLKKAGFEEVESMIDEIKFLISCPQTQVTN